MSRNNSDKVRASSSRSANAKIDQKIIDSITAAMQLKEKELTYKIHELDKETDIENILERNASALAFIGVLLGAFWSIYWLILPGLVLPFLFLHAIQGWCPPIPILRKFGVRTRKEIDNEKFALKIVRGDFDSLHQEKKSEKIFKLVKK